MSDAARARVLESVQRLQWNLPPDFHDTVAERTYHAAQEIAQRAQMRGLRKAGFDLDRGLDRLLTSRWLGFPLMLAILALVFWITIEGANVPSSLLAGLLIDTTQPLLKGFGETLGLPWWMNGFLFDGVYLATAWVVAVMLPPMAIFFPLFTLLEDFGYLPRVAFNLDALFRKAGAHGKQALTMCMGFGCNAAGVVSTRVIDSPRERLIAIITNNFSLCNGRWPTQILIATIFIGALAPAHLAGLVSAAAVVGIAVLGIGMMFAASWLPLADRAPGRGHQLQPGAAALPAAAHPADALYVGHRPDAHRPLARGDVRPAGRRGHLAAPRTSRWEARASRSTRSPGSTRWAC